MSAAARTLSGTATRAGAATAARTALTEYPQATMARVCLARALTTQKGPPDSIIPVLEAVLAVDSMSRPALEQLGLAYKAANQVDKSVQTWGRLIRFYPNDAKLVSEVVNEIAASGRPEIAKPIIEQAVEQNPGDPRSDEPPLPHPARIEGLEGRHEDRRRPRACRYFRVGGHRLLPPSRGRIRLR